MNEKPVHAWNCKKCIFLGNYEDKEGTYDLYLHYDRSNKLMTTLMANYGENYISGTIFGLLRLFRGETEHPLAVALYKCYMLGYINESTLELSVPLSPEDPASLETTLRDSNVASVEAPKDSKLSTAEDNVALVAISKVKEE